MKAKLFYKCKLSALLLASAFLAFNVSGADNSYDREAVKAAAIASNPLHYQQVAMSTLLLPNNLYILRGSSIAPSRLTVYYRNAVLSPVSNYAAVSSSLYGKTLLGRWYYESGSAETIEAVYPFDLNFSLTAANTQMNTATSVEIVDQIDTSPVRLMAIGDSITRMGEYLGQVQNVLTNVKTVGTVTYPNENIAREGRGGWTLKKYFSYIATSEFLDSPFLFPTTVSGSQYKGNTDDWKKICSAKETDTAYAGFKKIARGWNNEGEYLYDENGYYKYPAVGDVMVDPHLPAGAQWIEWNGMSWQPMSQQPTEFEFNFSKYMERFSSAYPDGAPTHISILLGANDFGSFDTLMDMPGYLTYLNELIASVHQYDPSIRIIICTPTLGPNTNIVTIDTDVYYRYNRNAKLAAYYMMKAYDNEESLAKNIYIAPMTLTLDTTNGYDYVKKQVAEGQGTVTKTAPKNTIHPNVSGHIQMGNTLAAVIQKSRNDLQSAD